MENKIVKHYIETIYFCPRYNSHWLEIFEVSEAEPDPTQYDFYKDKCCIGYRCFDAEELPRKDGMSLMERSKSHYVFFEDRLAAAKELMGWNPGIAEDDEIITAVE